MALAPVAGREGSSPDCSDLSPGVQPERRSRGAVQADGSRSSASQPEGQEVGESLLAAFEHGIQRGVGMQGGGQELL